MEGQRLSGGGEGGGGGPRRREVRVLEDAVELTRAAAAEVTAALALHRDAWLPGAAAGGAAGATFGTTSGAASGATSRATSGAAAAPFPSIALAGGSTPRALYRLLADPAAPFRARIDWQAVHFFWGDERHVPPDHPDSNFRMAREAMLDHVQVPAAHVHRIAGEEPDAARAARLYERGLIEAFGLRRDRGNGKDATDGESAAGSADAGASAARGAGEASTARGAGEADTARGAGEVSDAGAARDAAAGDAAREWPRFDLVLLGLGEEGHTASLFPGSPLLADDGPGRGPRRIRRLVASVWVEKLHTWRITLTPPVIDHAATVIFLVSGAAKAPALAAVLEGEWQPELYPAQVVAPVDGRLLWLVDRAAAAQLRSSS
jgi:6-phosphogluconolactonase